MRTNPRFLLPLAKGLACIAGVVAVLSFVVIAILHAQSEIATAHIVRYEEVKNDDSRNPSYKAVYAYDAQGGTFEGRSIEVVQKPDAIGAVLRIRYVKSHPDWSSEDKILSIYFLPIMAALASASMFAWYRFLLWRVKKKEANQSLEPTRMNDSSTIERH